MAVPACRLLLLIVAVVEAMVFSMVARRLAMKATSTASLATTSHT